MSSLAATRTSTGVSTGRRSYELLKDLVLMAAALAGLVALGWLVFAQLTGASVVVFRTGSMAPALPQGAAAVSMPATAADLAIGDIVTVRPFDGAGMPVTHRVVEISPVADNPAARELVLQGDDNDEVDLTPYVVTDVLRVEQGIPYGGTILGFLQTPVGLGLVVAAIGLLVLWACWPSPLESDHPRRVRGGVRGRHRQDT